MMSETNIRELLHNYNDNEISAVPVYKTIKGDIFSGKITKIKNWNVFSTRLPTEKEIDQWSLKGASGVAIVCGPISNICCVDADRDDTFALAKLQYSPVEIKGKKGFKRLFRGRDIDDPNSIYPTGNMQTHNNIEVFHSNKYVVVAGLHSQEKNNEPLWYKSTGQIDVENFDPLELPILDPNNIEIARNLGNQDEPIAPKVGQTGNEDGRFLDMKAEVGRVIAQKMSRDDAIQHCVDHGRERNPHNIFFKDAKHFHKCTDEISNAEWFIADHRLTFAAKKKHPQEIERPKTSTYSRLYEGKEWPEPTPFSIESHVTDIDIELIPAGHWRDWVISHAKNLGCEIAPVFLQSLTMLSSLIGNKTSIYPKKNDLGWIVFPILWTLHVGRSGSRKSPITDRVKKILMKFQLEQDETFKDEKKRLLPVLKRLKIRLKHAEGQLKQHVIDDIPHEIEASETIIANLEAEIAKYSIKRRQYIIDQITPEKLFEVLEQNPNGSLMYRDEFSSLWKTFKKSGYENFRTFLLSCHDGRGASYQTKNCGENFLTDASLALHGNIQPSLLEGMINETITDLADDGFLQRAFLTAETDMEKEVIDQAIDPKIEESVENIYSCANSLESSTVTLTTPAQEYFKNYCNQITTRTKKLDDFVGAFVSKFTGKIIIMGYLIEFIKPRKSKEQLKNISLSSLETAAEILEYNYRTLMLQFNRPTYTLASEFIEACKLRLIQTDEILSKLERTHCRFFRTKHTKNLLKILENHNYIRLEKVGKANILRINPHILGDTPDKKAIQSILN